VARQLEFAATTHSRFAFSARLSRGVTNQAMKNQTHYPPQPLRRKKKKGKTGHSLRKAGEGEGDSLGKEKNL